MEIGVDYSDGATDNLVDKVLDECFHVELLAVSVRLARQLLPDDPRKRLLRYVVR